MRVMIADDHPLFIEALENLLKTEFDIVCKVSDGRSAVREAVQIRPDVILMDINMPELDGIEATRQIMAEMPHIKIVILTSFEESDRLFRAVKAGAVGYLLKNLNGHEIVASLKELGQGRNPFAPGLEQLILCEFQRSYAKNTSGMQELAGKLNERQMRVLELVASGRTYRQVGDELFISERTVKYHMEKIKETLSLKTQEQVIALAWEKGVPRP